MNCPKCAGELEFIDRGQSGEFVYEYYYCSACDKQYRRKIKIEKHKRAWTVIEAVCSVLLIVTWIWFILFSGAG